MLKLKLTIVTANNLKFEELSALLSNYFECTQGVIKGYFEIQGTPEEIVAHKAQAAYDFFKKPVLVDDTSFGIDMLGGFPGPYMKDFTILLGIEEIGKRFAQEHAIVDCFLGIAYGADDILIASGTVSGTLVEAVEPVSRESTDFDPIFIPTGSEKTFSRMTRQEKNSISHRGLAMRNLIKMIESRI